METDDLPIAKQPESSLAGLVWPSCVQEIEQLGHAQNHIAGENWSQDSTWVKDPQVQQSWVVTGLL